jgi:hypothetical protein
MKEKTGKSIRNIPLNIHDQLLFLSVKEAEDVIAELIKGLDKNRKG